MLSSYIKLNQKHKLLKNCKRINIKDEKVTKSYKKLKKLHKYKVKSCPIHSAARKYCTVMVFRGLQHPHKH